MPYFAAGDAAMAMRVLWLGERHQLGVIRAILDGDRSRGWECQGPARRHQHWPRNRVAMRTVRAAPRSKTHPCFTGRQVRIHREIMTWLVRTSAAGSANSSLRLSSLD